MNNCQDIPDTIFSNSPLHKIVHFNDGDSIPPQSMISASLLSSSSRTSLAFPLVSEKPGVRFKLCCLLLSLIVALTIGLILSIVFIHQIINMPRQNKFSNRLLPKSLILNTINKTNHLFEHFDSIQLNELDFSESICNNFYGFVCGKWLSNHPLAPFELKRSWLTERSQDIRQKFADKLANLSEIEAYNYQTKVQKNQTQETTENSDVNYFDESISEKNE